MVPLGCHVLAIRESCLPKPDRGPVSSVEVRGVSSQVGPEVRDLWFANLLFLALGPSPKPRVASVEGAPLRRSLPAAACLVQRPASPEHSASSPYSSRDKRPI